jgi:uncharacterized surface protein with fasciclin (FAS1) repeats
MRKYLVVAAATVVAVATVAGTASARPQAGGTVVDVAASNKSFSTLVTLVKAAGFAGALSSPNAQLTVFAPTNAAFKKLGVAIPGVTKALTDPMNKGLLVRVLKYHVLGSKVMAADAVAAAKKNAKADTQVPVLRAMHTRRLRTYKSLGFTGEQAADVVSFQLEVSILGS